MYNIHAPTTKMLTSGPKFLLTKPITKGITAPPETAIINKPEISLARSGIFSKDKEKMIGNIFPAPSPIRNIEAKAIPVEGAKKTANTPASETKALRNRKKRGFIQFRIIAPRKREVVSPTKNIVIP